MLSRIQRVLAQFNERCGRLCSGVALVMLAAMTAVILLQVFYRYVLNAPLAWPEEAARYAMVWMTFLVTPAAYRRGLVVRMESTTVWLKGRARRMLDGVLHAGIGTLAVALLVQACWMVQRGGMRTSSALEIPMSVVFAILPISFALILLVSVEEVLRAIRPDGVVVADAPGPTMDAL